MSLFSWVLLCLVLLLSGGLDANASDRSWLDIRTAHFRILTDVGEKRGVEVARRCEEMRRTFAFLMPQAAVSDPAPLVIFALRGEEEVDQLASRNKNVRHSGIFIAGNDVSFILLDATGDPWHTVFHEYAHELLHANSPSATETWFEEGFGEYFSTIESDGKTTKLGQVPLGELQFLREKGNLMRLADLTKVDPKSPIYNQPGTMQATFYAQSWLFVHYLFDRQLIGRAQDLFAMTGDGMPFEDAVPAAFGMSRQKLEDDLLSYAQGEQFRFFSLAVPDSGAEKIDVSKLSDVSVAALELEASWHSEMEHEKSDAASFADRYRLLLAKEPENADVLRGRGVMLMEAGDYQQSLSNLRQAVKEAPGEPRNHLALARLLDLLEGTKGTTNTLTSSAEQEAAAALALDPDYADAYFLQASALARRGELGKAGALMRKAVALSPRSDAYKLTMADFDLQLRDYSPANTLLHHLTRSSDPEIARKAESFLSISAKQMPAGAR